MLKLGVWKKESFFAAPPAGLLARAYHLLSKSRISLDLLRLPPDPSPEDAAIFERLMPHVRLSSGIYRTTYRNRFRNLDPLINSLLTETFDPSDELRVEDWAASTCLTSCEWAKTLLSVFPKLRFVASDILLFLLEIDNPASQESFVFEPDGHPLQYIRPPFVIRMEPPEPLALPLNRLLYLHARRRWRSLLPLCTVPDSWVNALNDDPLDRDGYRLRKLPLIHPEALALARGDSRFMIRRGSIFESLANPCHVIRSMNVLNQAYFSEEELAQGARSAIASLLAGGIWIVGRTIAEDPPQHEVSIFRKQGSGKLEMVQRVGSGSEIESIALAVR